MSIRRLAYKSGWILALAAAAVLLPETAEACPMCKSAIEADSSEPRAYMLSILFMMTMIGSIGGGMAVLLGYICKSEQQRLEEFEELSSTSE